MTDRRELLDFAKNLAAEAAEIILPLYHGELEVEQKDDATPVTAADREAERHLRRRIEERFPEHAVLGEEFGLSGPERARFRWVIDPVDGTLSLTRRVPLFGTLVGLLEEGEPVVGVTQFPALGSVAAAAVGHGAFLDDTPIRASDCSKLADALLCATGFHMSELDGNEESPRANMIPLLRAVEQFRGWGDCYGHVLVASGRADAMVDFAMKPWDIASLVPILTEAGAKVSTLSGDTRDLVHGDSLVSAAPAIHGEVIQLLTPSGA